MLADNGGFFTIGPPGATQPLGAVLNPHRGMVAMHMEAGLPTYIDHLIRFRPIVLIISPPVGVPRLRVHVFEALRTLRRGKKIVAAVPVVPARFGFLLGSGGAQRTPLSIVGVAGLWPVRPKAVLTEVRAGPISPTLGNSWRTFE